MLASPASAAPQLQLSILQLLIELGVAQLEDHIAALHLRAGSEDDFFNPSLRGRRNPPDILRRECAETAHLPHHRPALDLCRPDDRALNRRRCRLQP